MIAYTIAVLLLGVLVGSVIGGAYALAEHKRRYHVSPKALERLIRD